MNTIPSQHEASSGHKLPRGVWIGGALMGLTIVALATALVVRSHPSDGATAAGPVATASAPDAGASTALAANDVTNGLPAPAAGPTPTTTAPAVAPVPVPVPVHHAPPRHPAVRHDEVGAPGGSSVAHDEQPARRTAAAVCGDCGVIESVHPVTVQGQSTGVGAVAGGAGGALIGSRIAGRGNHTLGGIIGAVGGGLLGNAIEHHARAVTEYDVHIRMDDGSTRVLRRATAPAVGEHVRVEGSTMREEPGQG